MHILEKVYSSHRPALSTSLRRIRELHWIKELGTAKPYGFDDQVKGVGTQSIASCKKTNIYALFNKHPRRNDHMAKDTTRKTSSSRVEYEHSCGPGGYD